MKEEIQKEKEKLRQLYEESYYEGRMKYRRSKKKYNYDPKGCFGGKTNRKNGR